jgi:hypothetical protein
LALGDIADGIGCLQTVAPVMQKVKYNKITAIEFYYALRQERQLITDNDDL